MNIKILPQQNRRLHQLINSIKLNQENKASLVYVYTGGRSESSADLLQTEASALINYLENLERQTDESERCNKMRKKILSLCHQMGWYRRDRGVLRFYKGKKILDLDAIDTFCEEKGPYKKPLNKHTYKELVVLVSVFEKVLQSEIAKMNA